MVNFDIFDLTLSDFKLMVEDDQAIGNHLLFSEIFLNRHFSTLYSLSIIAELTLYLSSFFASSVEIANQTWYKFAALHATFIGCSKLNVHYSLALTFIQKYELNIYKGGY